MHAGLRLLGGQHVRCSHVLLEKPEGRFGLRVRNKFCFHVGATGSGFPFDLGRIPYKGKRPLKDMIGSYKNRQSGGDPSTEGTSGRGGASMPAPETQLQAQSQQEELEQLRKDLASQKVCVLPRGQGTEGQKSRARLPVPLSVPSPGGCLCPKGLCCRGLRDAAALLAVCSETLGFPGRAGTLRRGSGSHSRSPAALRRGFSPAPVKLAFVRVPASC